MKGGIIAFGGKGGSGKTTLAAMVLRNLIRMGHTPVLAVDADPNATLAATLGVEIEDTIADLRDRMGEAAQQVSEIPKDRLMDQWLAQLLTEKKGFDLLTMGRPEGPKCYCYVNSLLRRYLKELRSNYATVLVDCEAGMEYLSRLVIDDVDTLVLVTEATPIGVKCAERISKLADALPVRVKQRVLVLNKVGRLGPDESPADLTHSVAADTTLHVPFDEELLRRCSRGEPIDDKAGGSSVAAIEELTHLCLKSSAKGINNPIQKEPIL